MGDCDILSNLRPCINLCLSAYNNKLEKTPAHNKNKYGDKIHPCLKTLWGYIRPFATLFIMTEKEEVVI